MESLVKNMTIADAEALVLKKGEIVEVKPIIRERAFFKKGHDGEFMFTGCTRGYQLPFSMSTHSYVQIFESAEQQEAFELLMNKPKGSLNIYDRKNAFWSKYKVEVTKEGTKLDLSIPSHALDHLLLKANKQRIAQDWSSRHRAGLEYALVNDSQVREDDNKRSDIFENAMDLFTKIRKSNSKMYNILRLLDKTPMKDNKDNTNYLKTEITKIIEQREKQPGNRIKTIHDFIKIAEDPKFEIKVLIYDAMDAKEILLRNGLFILAATDAPMGKSIEQTADWLESLQNNEEKIILQQRLKK